MPTSGEQEGKKYVPTPVHLQVAHQNSAYNPDDDVFLNTSTSQVLPPTPPPRIAQPLKSPKPKKSPYLKKASNKTPWTRQKKIIVGVIIAAIIIAIIIAAILLGVLLSRKSDTTTTTTQATITETAYWSFDGITSDLYNVYNGTLYNGAFFFSTSYNQPYAGVGRGISFTSTSNQYFVVTNPFLDLSYKSFTIETWIYPSITSNADFPIFGQCQCRSCSNQCLYITIRQYYIYVSFMNNDLAGNLTLTSNVWYHIAFVYDNSTQQQTLYVNGYQDATRSSAASYQGKNGSLLIGAAQIYVTMSYYNGYIDNFKITTRAKSAAEVLSAATLTSYYSFDLPTPYNDNGPFGLNGTGVGVAIVTGRVNQAIRFSGSSSYFYAYGFYQVGFGVLPNKPFSVSLWINPSTYSSSAIIQFAYSLWGSCYNFLGLYSANGVASQILVQGYAWPTIYGPFASVNAWTHVSVTYSYSNGYRLYVNGVYYGNTGTVTSSNTGYIVFLQLGYMTSCSSSTVPNGGYQGSVDEVYVHSRELAQGDITALANP